MPKFYRHSSFINPIYGIVFIILLVLSTTVNAQETPFKNWTDSLKLDSMDQVEQARQDSTEKVVRDSLRTAQKDSIRELKDSIRTVEDSIKTVQRDSIQKVRDSLQIIRDSIQTAFRDSVREARKADTVFVKKKIDSLEVGSSKSDYEDLDINGGISSVDADLKLDDQKKDAWLNNDYSKHVFDNYYDLKRNVKRKYNLAIGTDYMFLHQFSSFSFNEKNATSGIFRFFGTWAPVQMSKNRGALVFKVEHRHQIGTNGLPRNLGYEAGAALSTASFKEFGWGLTNLFWKQNFSDNKYGLAVGIMDPGDWLDLYPLLNSYKFFLGEAFFNSPTMALPNQGMGIVGTIRDIVPGVYVGGGIHDANGEPTKWIVENMESFFGDRERMQWVEAGWNPNRGEPITDGRTVHLMYWHQEARVKDREVGAEIEESWGLNFSAATSAFKNDYTIFLRAGYSEGNGATMRHLIQTGLSWKVIKHDRIGIGVHWGGPAQRSAPNQFGIESFYALQLTDNLNITPNVQLTINPSFNDQRDVVGVFSTFRLRYAM